MNDKMLLKKVRKSLGIDASNKRAWKAEAIGGGFKLTAKTAKASTELTRAHHATVGQVLL